MKRVLFLVLVLCAYVSHGQSHSVKGKIKGLNASDTVYLAQYSGKSLHYNDTTTVGNDGWFSFNGKSHEKGGKYVVFITKPKVYMVEVLLDTKDLVFTTDTANMDMNLEIVNSENNKIWHDYKQFIHEKNQKRAPFDVACKDSLLTEKERQVGCDGIKSLTEEVISEQKRIAEKHGDMLIGKFIKMGLEVEVPEAPEGEENEKVWRYNYYKDHYWDNVDLNDPRIFREQSFDRLLEKYVTKVIPQNPDSVFQNCVKVLDKVQGNYDTFRYMLTRMVYLSETSKVMCMDKAFVLFVNKYYKTGVVDWLDDERMTKIIEGADKKVPTLCGEVAPNIILPDTSDVWQNLGKIDSEYTLLIFWEPSCGHCKKEIPKIKAIYDEWKGKGLEVYAVCHEIEDKGWREFIKEKELDWINVKFNEKIMDPDSARTLIRENITTLGSLNYGPKYDISSTPQIYLLDKDKSIMFKQLNSEQLEKMIPDFLGSKEEDDQINDEVDQEMINENNKREKRQRKVK